MNFSLKRYFNRVRSIVFGILIISILPPLLIGFNSMQTFKAWAFSINGIERDLFPDIFDKYKYSMTIFFASLLIGLIIALILTFLTTLLPKILQQMIFGFLTLLESLPDLFIAVSLQFIIIYIFKRTGWLVADVTMFFNKPIYLLPIITLSILPTIQLFKMTLLLMKEEQQKSYVTVARAMGLGRLYITLKHVFRNIITSLFQYYKSIFVFMLSNLLIVEYVFNLNGFMITMLYSRGVAFVVTALILALPFSLVFELVENYAGSRSKQEKEEAA
ncbi:ABC transporter permease subunit [Bacillus sp. NEB1478]|uniref:ABC transporter permease subunit n=1 Tax=Bacillus sp. NEB1478 TaxID=3073816 RepID=UPI0028735367|nr:ABC transporter permease subunit [Bacillus sp. NEB1478]WNB91793.1 ABC transporter permease subunit [Bacillus sp. NEB1478]